MTLDGHISYAAVTFSHVPRSIFITKFYAKAVQWNLRIAIIYTIILSNLYNGGHVLFLTNILPIVRRRRRLCKTLLWLTFTHTLLTIPRQNEPLMACSSKLWKHSLYNTLNEPQYFLGGQIQTHVHLLMDLMFNSHTFRSGFSTKSVHIADNFKQNASCSYSKHILPIYADVVVITFKLNMQIWSNAV